MDRERHGQGTQGKKYRGFRENYSRQGNGAVGDKALFQASFPSFQAKTRSSGKGTWATRASEGGEMAVELPRRLPDLGVSEFSPHQDKGFREAYSIAYRFSVLRTEQSYLVLIPIRKLHSLDIFLIKHTF